MSGAIANLDGLERGDVLRNLKSNNTFIVVGRVGGFVVAVQEAVITDPADWELIEKKSEGAITALERNIRGDFAA